MIERAEQHVTNLVGDRSSEQGRQIRRRLLCYCADGSDVNSHQDAAPLFMIEQGASERERMEAGADLAGPVLQTQHQVAARPKRLSA